MVQGGVRNESRCGETSVLFALESSDTSAVGLSTTSHHDREPGHCWVKSFLEEVPVFTENSQYL